nr:Malate dehydrogenase [Klebsiella pneumoniae]
MLISAGVARKPGMDRSDLFNVNAGIVKNLVQQIAKTCPQACIGIITNPVNTTVAIAAEVLKKAGVYDKTNCSALPRWTSSVQYLCGGAER